MDLKSNVRRVMSNLSNISINTQDSFLIFGKYCIINKRVLVKKTEGLKEIWVDSDEDYLSIIKLAGFDLKKKIKKKKKKLLKTNKKKIKKFKNYKKKINRPYKNSINTKTKK